MLMVVISTIVAIGVFVVFVGNQKSKILLYLLDNGWYGPYHIILSFYCLFLGDFGRKLVNRSAADYLENLGKIPGVAPLAMKFKKKLLAPLQADWNSATSVPTILEIGAGSGSNFHYYPERCRIHACEPDPSSRETLLNKINERSRFELVGLYPHGAESLPEIPDNSVDIVIATNVLCSVSGVEETLREVRRVLKQGGKYYFSEHILDHSNIFRWLIKKTFTLTGNWPYTMLNCSFKDTIDVMKKEGIVIETSFNGEYPAQVSRILWLATPMIHGVAVCEDNQK